MIRLLTLDKNRLEPASKFLVTDGELRPIHAVNHFLWYLEEEIARKPLTRQSYLYTICDFYRHCEATGVDPLAVTKLDLQMYAKDMEEHRGNLPNTINSRLRALEVYYRFLLKNGYILRLPFDMVISRVNTHGMYTGTMTFSSARSTLRRRVNRRKGGKFVRRADVDEFIKSLTHSRDKVLATLLWSGGFRIHEAVSLTIQPPHLPLNLREYVRDEKSYQCQIVGKGSKTRTIEIPAEVLRDILYYIEEERPTTKSQRLFLNLYCGEPIMIAAIQAAFRRNSKRTNIKITPHMLRHANALERLIFWERIFQENDRLAGKPQQGGDVIKTVRYRALKTVSLELGHASVTTTDMTYLQYLDTYKAGVHGDHKKFMQQLRSGGST